jgi:hypothetical protein
MKITIRELLLLTLVVAIGLGWWADRFVYISRANANSEFTMIRHWQASTLWNWAKGSDFVKSIESDDHAITIKTRDGKVEVFPFPPARVQGISNYTLP